jgi:hypothetical protein
MYYLQVGLFLKKKTRTKTANKLRRSCFQVMRKELVHGPHLSPKTRGVKDESHVQAQQTNKKAVLRLLKIVF